MHDELPSISSLRAFVTAAETLSFKEAAARLHLSASAVSRQVMGLEELLDTRLFLRGNPGIELTPAGARYLETAARVLRELRAARDELRSEVREGSLRVSALESFSARWLVPRLSDFIAAHPAIELRIEATLRYADFDRDPVDVAIRFGTGPWADLHSEPIVDLDVFPVCSPELRDGPEPIRSLRDLANHPWIYVSQVPDAWNEWVQATDGAPAHGSRAIEYDHVGIALSAAESGQGVALSARLLCSAEIEDGRLCTPFDAKVRSEQTYHLVCRPESLDDPRIVAFRDWLVSTPD